MASIKISNLPDLMAPNVSVNDYFIVNDENQTTSKLKFTEFVTALSNQNYVFSGTVRFTGSVTIDIIDDSSSNVYTKASVNTLIAESEARSLVPVTANATDISQLQNLLPAPTSGGLFLAGTFSGAAAAATQVVNAINAVAAESDTTKSELSILEGFVNSNTSNIGVLQSVTAAHLLEINALKLSVNGDGTSTNPGFEGRIAANEVAIAALDDQLNAANTGVTAELSAIDVRVTDIETSLTATGGGIKDEVDANSVLAQQGVDDSAAVAVDVAQHRTDLKAALAQISTGLETYGTNNQSASGNDVIGELVRLIAIELDTGNLA